MTGSPASGSGTDHTAVRDVHGAVVHTVHGNVIVNGRSGAPRDEPGPSEADPAGLVPATPALPEWVVGRPDEVNQVVDMVLAEDAGTVGVTTALQGAGGFGKTTLARMVRSDQRVLRHFGGRVYWVTVSRDRRREGLVDPVNDLVRRIAPDRAQPFADLEQAAEHLAAVLAAGPRRLLILDDVWFDDQLAAFPVAGTCVRLVTTRKPSLVGEAATIRVGQMSPEQARILLSAGLPSLPAVVVDGLLAVTGRWPLLVRHVNGVLVDQTRIGANVVATAENVLDRFRKRGPGNIDELTGAVDLDVADPQQRAKAVAATIQASLDLLAGGDRDRLAEVAIFAEDETIPVSLLATLWQATASADREMDMVAAGALCARLADLALLTVSSVGGVVELHDVVRDYLIDQLGPAKVRALHQILLDAVAARLPTDDPPPWSQTGPAVAWWLLPDSDRYLWDHLIEHLHAAGRDAEQVASDLRWVAARLDQSDSPIAPSMDLARAGTPRTRRLQRILDQAAHLLTPTDPPHARRDILYSRVAHDPDWEKQANRLAERVPLPGLVNRWPPPDRPDPALHRTLTGHTGPVYAVAFSSDGSWLASADDDGTVRIWDTATGRQRHRLTDDTNGAWAVAVAPDGSWLATAGLHDGTVRIWNTTTGQQLRELTGHIDGLIAVAVAPDSKRLAVGGRGLVRIWDTTTGEPIGELDHIGNVLMVGFGPDSSRLFTHEADGKVRLWDVATGDELHELTGRVSAVGLAHDSLWLFSPDTATVRICNPINGQFIRELTLDTGWQKLTMLAVASDGSRLATDRGVPPQVRIWDTTTGQLIRELTGHTADVSAVAVAPDGSWLASGSRDGTVRIWDTTAVQQPQQPFTRRTDSVDAVAVALDGSWLATVCGYGSVRIWDTTTGQELHQLSGHTTSANAVAVFANGSRLAADDSGGWLLFWKFGAGRPIRDLYTRTWWELQDVREIAASPECSLVATTGHDRRWSVLIWDNATDEEPCEVGDDTSNEEDRADAAAFSPDGSWLAINYRESVRIWDTTTGEELHQLTGHTDWIRAVAVSPDGSWLASADDNGTVRIWDTATGRAVGMTRMESGVNSCVWSPDGETLFIGGDGGLYAFTVRHET